MNTTMLSAAVREMSKRVEDNDASECLRVLARIVEGKSIKYAFGAPGDWGYEHPIGAALALPGPEPAKCVIHGKLGCRDPRCDGPAEAAARERGE